MARMDFPLNTTVSRKVISFSDISAVNFIVGCVSLFNETIYFFSCTVPKGENVTQCNVPILLAWCFSELSLLFFWKSLKNMLVRAKL